MTDLKLQWLADEFSADLVVADNDLATTEDLDTAILISLFTDKRAPDDAELPDGDRRGWWGDSFPEIEGDEIGSHLWLLERETQTQAVLERARLYAREALTWMLDDGVLQALDVAASYPERAWLQLEIDATDSTGRTVRLSYQIDAGGSVIAADDIPETEIRGESGVAPIVAAAWEAGAVGAGGEIGCGDTSLPPGTAITCDLTVISVDSTLHTADEA